MIRIFVLQSSNIYYETDTIEKMNSLIGIDLFNCQRFHVAIEIKL